MEAVLSPPRWPVQQQRLLPSFVLALLMHGVLFVGMSIAVRWNVEPQAAAYAELWGALPPIETPALPRPQPQPEPPPRIEPKPEPTRPEVDIALEQERKKREQERLDAEKRQRAEEEARKQAEADKQRKAAEEKRLQAEREAFRQAMEQRMLAQADTKAGAAGTSAVRGASGTDASYSAAVVACIRQHIAYAVPEGTPPTVTAEFRVELLPDASVASVALLKPSALPGYDAAAERAIRRCDPFPRKRDGTVDRTIIVTLRPVEMR